MKSKAQTKAFFSALEAERNDITYRKARTAQSEVVYVKVYPANQKRRDQVMYHAGRYSEGARDPEAVKGYRQMKTLLAKEQNG